jgi:O-methyltransferase
MARRIIKKLSSSFFRLCVLALSLCGLLFIATSVRVFRFYHLLSAQARPLESPSISRRTGDSGSIQDHYLNLMKTVLTRYGLEDRQIPLIRPQSPLDKLTSPFLKHGPLPLFWRASFDPLTQESGKSWPSQAETMIGLTRLDHLQNCVTDVLLRNVPGDLIETGAWRGGACIFMRAVLKAHGDVERIVWVADSFQGLPKPRANTEDAKLWREGEMAVSLESVRNNFARNGLLDSQVRFLRGFFIDTLPRAPIGRLAILRVDCDLYDSVTQSLEYLYDKVSRGGYVIIDDYGSLPPAKKAVDDYRRNHGIAEELQPIDWSGYFWQKQK